MFKGQKNVSSYNPFCDEVDACLPCPDDKIKSVPGDDPALCTETCDGVTNVANVEHTACGNMICNEFSTKF